MTTTTQSAFSATSVAVLLLAMLVIASATDYGYNGPKPEAIDNKLLPTSLPNKYVSVIQGKDKLLPTTVGIQGLVLCKSGPKYFPLEGAVARISCLAVNEHGYERAPFSILSPATDNKGYFFTTLSKLSFPKIGEKYNKIIECKVFVESSPLKTCKNPNNVNKGIKGALLSSYRILIDKKIKLYSVGPFFYTSEVPKPVPVGY
ncbi:Pollen Ole e 1 allergen/extensin [Quillaja saponaria]|uniref:Pollen Ole e 1 allergen/extensin n=1 Tax=Quillaja saponaria TaxID=32244 RepID=A0AAD7Q1B0_QUISA|nr:Pollen Ole e 1 allergen/extensin [Quillaja saponaria]